MFDGTPVAARKPPPVWSMPKKMDATTATYAFPSADQCDEQALGRHPSAKPDHERR